MKTIINYRNKPVSFFNEELFGNWNDFFTPATKSEAHLASNFPKYDVEENEKYYLMSFDIPGVKKENIQLEIKEGYLKLSGERKRVLTSDHYSERFSGAFQRTFALPEHLDIENIAAHYEDGVLRIILPKAEFKSGRKIEISDGVNNQGLISKFLNHLKKESPPGTSKDADSAA